MLALSGNKEAHAAPSGGGGGASKPKPKPTNSASKPHAANEVPPADVLQRITAALATNDPKQIRAVAAQLRKEGWVYQADQLMAAAATLEQAQAIVPILPPTAQETGVPAGTVVFPDVAPAVQPPALNLPSAPAVQPSSDASDGQGLAIEVQRMLTSSTPYHEDRALVKRWQLAEGVKAPDGMYGPNAAKLAMKYGLVPVKPFYWSKTSAAQQKQQWKALMNSRAKKDPSRAAEWQAAGRV
jgi:hypothetical protein